MQDGLPLSMLRPQGHEQQQPHSRREEYRARARGSLRRGSIDHVSRVWHRRRGKSGKERWTVAAMSGVRWIFSRGGEPSQIIAFPTPQRCTVVPVCVSRGLHLMAIFHGLVGAARTALKDQPISTCVVQQQQEKRNHHHCFCRYIFPAPLT